MHTKVDPKMEAENKPVAIGLPASPGGATGRIVFNADDAAVVYISLLSLLIAWFLGLMITKSKNEIKPVYWIFRQIDNTVFSLNWRFWLDLSVISISTSQNPTESPKITQNH